MSTIGMLIRVGHVAQRPDRPMQAMQPKLDGLKKQGNLSTKLSPSNAPPMLKQCPSIHWAMPLLLLLILNQSLLLNQKPIKKSLVAPPPATNDYHAVDYSGIWNEVTGGEISIPKNTATWKKLQLAFGKEKTLAGWRRYCEEIYREGREQYASAANFAKSPKKYMFNKPEQSRWGKLA